MDKFETFKLSYDKSVAEIKHYLKLDGHKSGLAKLAEWFLTTDANPYSFLPHDWASSFNTAEGFSSLLKYIDHACYDDGDITFVKVLDEPRIVFAHRHDDWFEDLCFRDNEKEYMRRTFKKVEIEVLNIGPEEFGPIYDEYQRERIKMFFM